MSGSLQRYRKSNATNGVTIVDNQGVGTITDNDTDANITIDDVVVVEGDDAVFTVSLDNAVSGGFTVDYSTADISATSGEDYITANGSVNFSGTAGETQTITVSTVDNSIFENTEQFAVNIATSSSVTVLDGQGLATINDDDSASISIGDVVVEEGNTASFTVSLDVAVSGGFTVDYTTASNTATADVDFNSASGTLNFSGTAGETQTIAVTTTDDSFFEGTESFFVNLSNATNNVNITDAQGIGTITDNDTAAITINDASIIEGNNMVFTVTLDNEVGSGFSVDFSTANNSATAGFDFTSTTGTLNFTGTAGETQNIIVTTLEDAVLEGSESFFVDLSNVTGGVTIADAQGLGTITDNDSASITIDDTSISEGNSAILTVTVNNAVSGGFSVDFATSGNTATQGVDFAANSGTLNFIGTAGESQTITINTTDDSIVENSESFFVNLTNATNGVSIADAQGIVTISDNDNASVAIDNTTITEGNTAILTVTLDNAVSGGFTVDYNTAGNTATSGADFTPSSGTLIFAGTAGETQTVNISTINDAAAEGSESFFVNLSNATNGIGISDNQGEVTLVDDDTANIFISDSAIGEGNTMILDVSLSANVSGGFSVDYTTASNTAISGVDFTPASGTLNFSGIAGETESITVSTIDDSVVEGTESLFVNLSNATNGVTIADGQGEGIINDNDNASISINNVVIDEGGVATFTVTLDNEVSGGFSVSFSTASNTAVAGADFVANSGTLNFIGTAAETQTITVNTIDDSTVESSESFYVDLSNASNGVTIADAQGVANITDNDTASIAIGDTGVTEGNSAVLSVILTGEVSGGFSVNFSTQGNSATQAVDFLFNSGVLNFTGTAGEVQTITITTNDDSVVENTESFFVNLSSATNGVTISDNQAIVTIVDNDNPPATANITINDIQITEGENATFTVTLDSAVSGGFTVNYTSVDESAVAGSDYVAANGNISFSGVAGETQSIVVLSLDDLEVEGTESFSINLSNASNGVNILDPSGRASITDNDSEEEEEPLTITISDGEAQEGGSIFFEVTLSREFDEDLVIFYEIINESASAEDYEFDINSIVILAGETSAQIVVAALNDEEIEEAETFRVRLLDPANSIIVLANDIAIGTILDSTSEAEEPEMVLFPVPLRAGNDLSVDRIVDGEYFLSIYTHTGQLLYQDEITVSNNTYTFNLDDSLAAGFFLLRMANISAGVQYDKIFIVSP